MAFKDESINLADLVDGDLAGPEWDAWLAAHPEAAEEVAIARRVRMLLGRMQESDLALPADFEARLMARIREDRTLLELIDLGLSGLGRTLIELLNLLLSLLPTPPPALDLSPAA